METDGANDTIEDLSYRLGIVEEEVVRARRAAETTRSIAIGLAILYVGIPLVLMLLGFIGFLLPGGRVLGP